MKPFLKTAVVSAVGLSVTGLAGAHTEGAHVHGEAQMAVVVEGETVSVSLNSAMYNIVGFERAPNGAEEEAALAAAIETLKDGDSVISFSEAAACSFVSASHSLPKMKDDHDHDHDHGDNSHDHDGHDHGEHNHYRDLEAEYTFTCEDANRLADATVNLFASFERLEKIDLVVLSDDDQAAGSLTPDENTLTF